SLLITVAMFAILSILIMSVLAMTTSGYSMRIKSNKRIENFYAADSGLEIAQKVLHDYLGLSVKKANEVVELDISKPMSEKMLIFKTEFIRELRLNSLEGRPRIESEIKNSSKYDNYKRENNLSPIVIDTKLNYLLKDENKKNENDNSVVIDDSSTRDSVLNYENKEINGFVLDVNSKFTDKNGNEREVSVEFHIEIPEYGKELIEAKNATAPSILNYIVGVDGDYTITTDTATTVLGDMWVKGNGANENSNSSNKYNGGITVKQAENSPYGPPQVSWNGKIATNSTLNIQDVIFKMSNENSGSEGNIYARNVKIDGNKTKPVGDNKLFGNRTNMSVYNDFIMNGIENELELQNYYGLNDINDYENEWQGGNLKTAQKSSAMIINSIDFGIKSKINVIKDLYLLGTSYLELTGQDYQTGQSTIINQVSRPYTIQDGKYIYEYKKYENGAIQIAEKNNSDDEIDLVLKDKIAMAESFYQTNGAEFKNGITVPEKNVGTTGVLLANGEVIANTFTGEKITRAEDKQKEFVKEVFNMGDEKEYSKTDFWKNKLNYSVEDSFNWNEIDKIATEYYRSSPETPENALDPKVVFKGGNDKDFIHLTTKMTLNDIMDEAKKDNHELGTYGKVWTDVKQVPHMILSSSSKEIVLRNVANNREPQLISKPEDSKIIYEVNIGNVNEAPPLLVIAKGKVTVEPFNGYNHTMLISKDNVEVIIPYGSTAIIGNYDAGNGKGDKKLINELFKYVLESNKILGSIGGSIFEGNEMVVAENAIEISKLIKRKNWVLKK
ncbi:MAG: pilus assembly PilX N-terminal domain-containing protein, partial [Cetobacterium sp.]